MRDVSAFLFYRDFVLFNYTIQNVLNIASGKDGERMAQTRRRVERMLITDMGLVREEYQNFIDWNFEYSWKKLENTDLESGITVEKVFYNFEDAKAEVIKSHPGYGITYNRLSKTYELRIGNKLKSSSTQDSWVPIPIIPKL